jgi:hypothetical protein
MVPAGVRTEGSYAMVPTGVRAEGSSVRLQANSQENDTHPCPDKSSPQPHTLFP